ncbi:hypothetical protein CBR_g41327 [Chara braunii]|uniref:Uncharacterized protein n=1 Tax=Chara braunii TaxID=69332 RepID=A0A388LVH7_CHABU|nr:hypothetical protein CBR_g41327 [Chara braunii]|eukprot:GBG86334.1 hypothetical protein CBR_g41327 [Chara braunii]
MSGVTPMQQAVAIPPPTPLQYPRAPQGPQQPLGIQPWQFRGKWPLNGQWGVPPTTHMPPPANQPPGHQVAPLQGGSSGLNNASSSNSRKGPTANEFPGPGNKVYFTKEYVDILEDIRMNKAVEEARKKISCSRRNSVHIGEPLDKDSRSNMRSADEGKSGDKSDEMKAWVTTTFESSLKLITEKLHEVDQKVKLTSEDKAELARLREEKATLEKATVKKVAAENESKELSSSEKRNRGGERTLIDISPRIIWVRSRGSKTKPRTKRIDVSFDEEDGSVGAVKQNLKPKMETSSELSDIKAMLAALLQSFADVKGKAPVIEHAPVTVPEDEMHGEKEDVDIVQNATNKEEEEECDEGGLAVYLKMRQEFYSSLHYTRVQELCKEKSIPYFKKDLGAWELAKHDLQEYADMLKDDKAVKVAESSRKTEGRKTENR